MKTLLHYITDRMLTKKGMWITLAIWLIVATVLAVFAPSAKEYEVSSIDSLPESAQSIVAQKKVDHYFEGNDGTPALLVFHSPEGEIELTELITLMDTIEQENINGVDLPISLSDLPPQVANTFFSDDRTTALLPINFDAVLETKQIKQSIDKIYALVEKNDSGSITLYVTGPAGIAADTLDLFSRADIVLLLSTVGIILILLVITYRSPLLAFIPLLAAAFVYEVVNQTLGLMGKGGLLLSNQSLSIMTILLFAAVIDYSLFVFSRYREELRRYESKFDAMKWAMRGVGIPVFYSGGTVFAAMLVLFFAQYGDYQNFAPIFGTTMVVVMLASITLVPALFTIFGRRSFWPKTPRVGDENIKTNALWSRVGRFVTQKPLTSITVVGIFLLVSASNIVNMTYEFDTIKSFPEDMPSRVGYSLLEENFEKGDLAPTTVLFESEEVITEEQQQELMDTLLDYPLVSNVRISGITDDKKSMTYSLTFEESPYDVQTMEALEELRDNARHILTETQLNGSLYFAGETATSADDRSVNNRDLVLIVLLETILIFTLLIFLTKSFKMPIYMMGTILLSYLAALGLGMLLSDWFFGINTVSNRVPVYSFVFLIALGIDYNIILVSRYLEERKKHPVKKATQIAVSTTGGVISSAGVILAATFAVLMTQPIEMLFVFGFIVAVGIILDTFLVRGVLLPSLLVLLEKDK